MSALIKNLHIKNYKSVRDLHLDCERINVFIGKPNAGKSNILESISLLGADFNKIPYPNKFMEGYLRYNTITQLFSNYNTRQPIEIDADKEGVTLGVEQGNNFLFQTHQSPLNEEAKVPTSEITNRIVPQSCSMIIENDGRIAKSEHHASFFDYPVKRYEFKLLGNYIENGLSLTPPNGDNFYFIVRSHQELREEIQQFLKPNGLELLLDEETKRIVVVQRESSALISFPLSLVPDTFQRYIFHLAAIFSNKNAVLLFEEPETHSYPPYVYQLAQHILQDDRNNQFFLTTHNPYLLIPILKEAANDVALFVTWFENYQTYAKRISEEEIEEILDYGLDVFLNLKNLIPAA